MAANMPVWITKTLGFLGHPRGQQPIAALAPSHQLEQASSTYSKALPPLPRKAHLERQRVRAIRRSRRSNIGSPTWDDSRLRKEERSPTALEKPTTTEYEDTATQTSEAHDGQRREAIRAVDHPDDPSWKAAVVEDRPSSGNNLSPTALVSNHAFQTTDDSNDQPQDPPGSEPGHGPENSPIENRSSSTIAWTSKPQEETNHSHEYHERSETNSERHLHSPPISYLEEGFIPSFDAKAADEAMDVDRHSMQNPSKSLDDEEQLATDNDTPNGPPYTEGAAQIVLASDGLKDCLALLLTAEMVTKISQIATRSRRLEFIRKDLRKVKREVESEKNMIAYKTDALQDTNDQAEIAKIHEEISNTRSRLAAAVQCVEAIEEEVLTLTDNLAFSREQCQEMLEDVLGREDLLEVADPEISGEVDPTVSRGSRYSVEHPLGEEGVPPVERQGAGEEIINVQLEDVVRRTAKEDFEEKRNHFYTLDEAFEHRQENLVAEKAEYLRRVEEGTCELSQTDFDLLALEDFQRLTANLRHAEMEFEDAFKRAKQLGVLDEHDAYYQQSVFSEWSGGYPMSMEDAMVGCAPTKRIDFWQDRVDESQGAGLEPWGNPELEPEDRAMEDCDVKSVAISDSWSCVDWTRNRRRIDRWREIAGRDR
ncbi:MAG: hypothetical protein Q9168_000492 [Polycauliona sp. 1 TL-2023]